MIMLAIVLIGFIALNSLPLDLMPTLDLPIAAVVTSMPGASPSEVEQQVTKPIEQALQTLSGVSEIDSTSSQNTSQVIVQFNYGVDLASEIEDMRGIINRVTNQLPSTANSPLVQQFDPNSQPIMTVTLSAGNKSLSNLSDLAQNIIQPDLQQVNGVGTVNMIGNLTRQIQVQVDPAKLTYYGLSIQQIVNAISADNSSANVGQINRGSQLIPLTVNGQFTSVNDLLQVPILIGTKAITIGDVAKVVDGNQDVNLIATVDNNSAVGFSIVQASGANTVQVSDAVHQELQRISKQLPPGTKITVVSDTAKYIRETVDLVAQHTLLGFLFGILIMLGILRSVRTTVVIAVAIPIAVLATFILMFLDNLTINIITLGSLAIALGSLVDFSVVVLESIFRARQSGLDPKQAASVGTKEVGTAVFVAALAQICVFAPSIFTSGIAGQIFGPMALTVVFSHAVALLVALTLTPMLASKLLAGKKFTEVETIPGVDAPFRIWAPYDWFGKGMHKLTEAYKSVLTWGLAHRKTVVAVSILMFFGVMPLIPLVGTELMTPINTNQINVSLTLPSGTSLVNTTQAIQNIEKNLKAHEKSISSIYAQIGGSSGGLGQNASSNLASLIITIGNPGKQSMDQIAQSMKGYMQDVPGTKVVASVASAMRGPSSGQVQIQIQGPDLNTLTMLSNEVANIMKSVPQLQYVDNQMATGQPSYQLNISHTALVQNGLTEQQVVNALRTSFEGTNASTFYQGDNQYNIEVMFPETYSRDVTKILQTNISNGAGDLVPLGELATLTLTQEPISLNHYNGTRSVTVQADVFGTSSGAAQAQVQQKIKALRIPAGYTIGSGQSAKFMGQAFMSLGIGLGVSIILVYMVMASLFESLLTPFVIMFSLPPTFVGALLGLLITHETLNMNSLMGIIMLIGLVTNNAIVLIDYTNQLKAKGMTLTEALLQAGPIRLRPILLTTATTVLAMLPMLIIGGTGSEGLASMSAVITFGLTLSTLVTLLLVPVMYVNFDNFLNRHKAKKHPAVTAEGSLPA